MSGAGEPRTSIFSEPPCDSDKGDSRPQADNHVGENFGGVCVEPLVLPVLQTLPSFYSRCIEVSYSCPPASVARWHCTWALGNGEPQDSCKQGANANKRGKKRLDSILQLWSACPPRAI